MISLIVFDWDDTITLGSKEGYFACYKGALEGVGLALSDEEIWHAIELKWGQPHREALSVAIGERVDLLDRAGELYEELLFGDAFVSKLKILVGVPELLTRLASTYQLAVATGMHGNLLRDRVMPYLGIPDVFSRIVSAYDLVDPALSKPNPYMLNKIMSELGVRPEDTVMVGDAMADVLMAQATGVTPIVVLTGHLNEAEARDLGVENIISDVLQLEDAVRG